MAGDRSEGTEELPDDGRYYGPFYSAPPAPPPTQQVGFGQPAAEQPVQTWTAPDLATIAGGANATTPPSVSNARPRPAGRVVLAAGLTALLVGGGAGYGGALLAGRTADRQAVDQPSAAAQPTLAGGAGPVATPSAIAGASSSAPARTLTTVQIAATVLPGTVMIQAGDATGSGFVLDTAGRIMTNNHVVAAAGGGRIRVVFSDGRRASAYLLGRSPSYDLAVIQVKAGGLRPLRIGDSDASRVGESVIAVGSPLGLPGTVTQGIVSAQHRPVAVSDANNADAPTAYIDAIQTDAPINPGNSGGPLVDSAARVIGVNSAILTLGSSRSQEGNIGLGFAIPINQAVEIGQQLIATGKATYPVVGANVVAARGGAGVTLNSVEKSGPASKAGLRNGDLITKINGTRVDGVEQLIVAIRTHRPYETIVLNYSRGRLRSQARVVLGSKEG